MISKSLSFKIFSFLKLIPIRPWGDNYNISVWFISLKGIDYGPIIDEVVNDFKNFKDREKKNQWLSLTRQIFKEKSCEIIKSNEINPLMHVLEDPVITEIFEYIMKGKYNKSINSLKKLENNNSFEKYLLELPYKLFYRRIDFITDEISNLITKAENNYRLENHFQINKRYKIEDCLSEDLNPEDSKNKNSEKTLNTNSNIHENSFFNQSLNHENNSIAKTRTNFLGNRFDNLINNINHELNLENRLGINHNPNNEIEEQLSDNYDIGLEDLKFDSLLDNSNLDFDSNHYIDNNTNKYVNIPCGRGGHTMVLDEENSIIYMFGGWDGNHELDDFWLFDIKNENWKQISSSTFLDKGPSARSCHRMVFDNLKKKIFIYGRYKATQVKKNNKLYEYDVLKNKWDNFIIDDEIDEKENIKKGGPGQIYDHQMCIDSENQIIYIFGGIKIPEQEDLNGKYLGLWSLDLKKKIWKNLFNDLVQDHFDLKLKTRTGHSMLFDPVMQELIIIGGNRISKKKNEISSQLFEIIVYDIKFKSLKELFHDYSKEKGPDVNFSLNAFFNYEKRELILFGGGLKSDKQDIVSNNFWVLNLNIKKWDRVIKSNFIINYDAIMQEDLNIYFESKNFLNENKEEGRENFQKIPNKYLLNLMNNNSNNSQDCQLNEPMPRFAHSLVYSIKLDRGFIYGGNPYIKTSHCCVRYNDLWTFALIKPNSLLIKNMLKFKILRLGFIDACSNFKLEKALKILKEIKNMDHNDNEIKELINFFFNFHNKDKNETNTNLLRYELFDEIRKYINDYY